MDSYEIIMTPDAKQVYIMNVIYNRRDQLRQLANMKLD